MADTRYESRYNRTERNVMWTGATGGEVTPATAADTTTEAPGATQGTAESEVAGDTGTVY